MKPNEAIKILTNIEAYLIAGNPIWDTDTIREAMDMAIEELEDGDGVADALNGYAELYRKLKEKYDNLKKQTQWIPCEERLPEEDTEVLISYRYKEGEGDTSHTYIDSTTYGQMYFGGNKGGDYKHWRAPFEYFESNYEVIAWMPLPKPYEGRTE